MFRSTPEHKPPDLHRRRIGTWLLFAALLLATNVGLVGLAGAQEAEPRRLTFGPPDPDNNGLPAWISSPGAQPCSLTLVDDHGPYYAIEAVGTAGSIRFKYIAAVEGMPFGDAETGDPTPFMMNLVLVRVEGLADGTYTVEEPHGIITSITSSGGRVVEEETDNGDPAAGPVVDLTVTNGLFRVLRGTEVIISAPVDHTCAPYAGDPNNAPPTPSFTATCTGLTCSFDASASTDSDGEILDYGWNFGDGSPTGSGVRVNHTYATGGTKTIILSVTDNNGTMRATTRTVTMNSPPTAQFAFHCTGRTCSFDGGISTDPNGVIVSYAWDFGDGTTGTGATPSHTFAANGQYNVTLTVTDDEGATGTRTRQVSLNAPPPSATFRPHDGNNWWVQVRVTSSSTPTAVCASVNGGACQPLSLRSWGSWANSFFVATGSRVTFTATFPGGDVTSGAYNWPSGTPAGDGPAPPPPTGGPATATFRPHDGNNWWVQVRITSSSTPTAVCASVNGGACQPLSLRSWGSWANSFFVATGSRVTFTATFAGGQQVTSGAFHWPSGAPVDGSTPPPPAGGFSASFRVGGHNQWWVETFVTANAPIAKVEAQVNGGSFVVLDRTSWGSYAKSFFVPDGSTVKFRATSTSGATADSGNYVWPSGTPA